MFRDRKLFEKSIGLVMLWLRLHTSNTRLVELLYISQIRYSLVVILELNSVSEVQYKDMMIDR